MERNDPIVAMMTQVFDENEHQYPGFGFNGGKVGKEHGEHVYVLLAFIETKLPERGRLTYFTRSLMGGDLHAKEFILLFMSTSVRALKRDINP